MQVVRCTKVSVAPKRKHPTYVLIKNQLGKFGELLTSRPPFSGDTTESVIYQHVRENPVPPSQIDPEVIAAVITR